MENETQSISKTQKKKEAHNLQKLGETLAELPIPHLKQMDLPERLRTALIEAKSITANVATRRHRQYIGALMRDVDPEAIQRELDGLDETPPDEPAPPTEQQIWVERLLTFEDQAVEDCVTAFPGLERQHVRQLLRNVKKEQGSKKPSKSLKALEALLLDQLTLS